VLLKRKVLAVVKKGLECGRATFGGDVMARLIRIQITKAALYIYEHELMKALPPELLAEGLRRGKCIQRAEKQQIREQDKRGR
jgi:hypothetical protein